MGLFDLVTCVVDTTAQTVVDIYRQLIVKRSIRWSRTSDVLVGSLGEEFIILGP